MFKIRIVENKNKEISEAIDDLESEKLVKAYDDILKDTETLMKSQEEGDLESLEKDLDLLADAHKELINAQDENSKSQAKEGFKSLLNNFQAKYKTDDQDTQQQAASSEGEAVEHPLVPGKKISQKEYWLTKMVFPKVTGVDIEDKDRLKKFNPFVNPPAGTAISLLSKMLSSKVNEEEDRREGDKDDEGAEKRKKKISPRDALSVLENAAPTSPGLHALYRWMTDQAVQFMKPEADKLSQRNAARNSSGETNIQYPQPWLSPTITEREQSPVIDSEFQGAFGYIMDKVAAQASINYKETGIPLQSFPSADQRSEPGDKPVSGPQTGESFKEPEEEPKKTPEEGVLSISKNELAVVLNQLRNTGKFDIEKFGKEIKNIAMLKVKSAMEKTLKDIESHRVSKKAKEEDTRNITSVGKHILNNLEKSLNKILDKDELIKLSKLQEHLLEFKNNYIKTIVENNKPVSYKIKIIKANA